MLKKTLYIVIIAFCNFSTTSYSNDSQQSLPSKSSLISQKINISANEFKKLFIENNQNFFNNYRIKGKIDLRGVKANRLSFNNCIIDDIELIKANFNSLIITKSTTGDINMSKAKFSKLEISEESKIKYLKMENAVITNTVKISKVTANSINMKNITANLVDLDNTSSNSISLDNAKISTFISMNN